MRFKTDENLHPDVAAFLRDQGHDALTVWDQGLRGKPDSRVADSCRLEDRALLTAARPATRGLPTAHRLTCATGAARVVPGGHRELENQTGPGNVFHAPPLFVPALREPDEESLQGTA